MDAWSPEWQRLASHALPRDEADRLLARIKKVAVDINRDEAMMLKIARLAVFGSYLSDKQVLGDLDIAVQWESKSGDFEELQAAFLRKHPCPMEDEERASPSLSAVLISLWPEMLLMGLLRVSPDVQVVWWPCLPREIHAGVNPIQVIALDDADG